MASADKTNDKSSSSKGGDPGETQVVSVGGDASVSPGGTNTQASVQRPEVEPYATTTADAVNPATGEKFAAGGFAGHKGRAGFETVDAGGQVVPVVDPNRVPAEASPSVAPDAGGDQLLAAAQAKAPSLTRAFCDAYGLGDDILAGIARGEIPPPPTIGPVHTSDLYLTPGGWVSAPPGVPLEAAGGNAIAR
jgi:hypothetical protein